jgi:hypothetical protein
VAEDIQRLDWRQHNVGQKQGPCRLCGRPAFMRDETNTPCHKTCAELELAQIQEASA